MNPPNVNQIFSSIGLKPKFGSADVLASSFLLGPAFRSYLRRDYPLSPEHEMDEIYRMYETIRIHIPTGLRFFCFTHESYDGDSVDYTLFRPHIISLSGAKLQALAVDQERSLVTTPEGDVPFSDISREPE